MNTTSNRASDVSTYFMYADSFSSIVKAKVFVTGLNCIVIRGKVNSAMLISAICTPVLKSAMSMYFSLSGRGSPFGSLSGKEQMEARSVESWFMATALLDFGFWIRHRYY